MNFNPTSLADETADVNRLRDRVGNIVDQEIEYWTARQGRQYPQSRETVRKISQRIAARVRQIWARPRHETPRWSLRYWSASRVHRDATGVVNPDNDWTAPDPNYDSDDLDDPRK